MPKKLLINVNFGPILTRIEVPDSVFLPDFIERLPYKRLIYCDEMSSFHKESVDVHYMSKAFHHLLYSEDKPPYISFAYTLDRVGKVGDIPGHCQEVTGRLEIFPEGDDDVILEDTIKRVIENPNNNFYEAYSIDDHMKYAKLFFINQEFVRWLVEIVEDRPKMSREDLIRAGPPISKNTQSWEDFESILKGFNPDYDGFLLERRLLESKIGDVSKGKEVFDEFTNRLILPVYKGPNSRYIPRPAYATKIVPTGDGGLDIMPDPTRALPTVGEN